MERDRIEGQRKRLPGRSSEKIGIFRAEADKLAGGRDVRT